MSNPERESGLEIPSLNVEAACVEREDKEARIRELVEFRYRQSFGSMLAEYITGLRPDDPKMIERLRDDQKIIRAKYQLPESTAIPNPADYERLLRNIAKELAVEIKERSACGSFFTENFFAGGVHFKGEKKIGVDIKRRNLLEYRKDLRVLEHELIHALQGLNSPQMPIELAEYEAYIAGCNIEFMRTDSNIKNLESFFSFFIGGSVNHYYKYLSNKEGRKIIPKWDDPKFFLEEIDGVDKDEVSKVLRTNTDSK
ncbi:MAG: hypothetical protein AAB460_03515 [Patescibacteria group bacterium]